MNEFVKELAKMVKKVKTSAYDTTATVMRIDGETVYVHIEGGADETPAQKTISCKKGDKVKIRVSGGKAWITGNLTSPPTDDSTAEEQARVFEKKMGSMSSSITQTAKEISSKVSKGDVISTINQTAEAVKIKAGKIEFDGNTDINGNVIIGGKDNVDGTLTVKNADSETVGTWTKDGIYTISGKIGGWTIGTDLIMSVLGGSDSRVNSIKLTSASQSASRMPALTLDSITNTGGITYNMSIYPYGVVGSGQQAGDVNYVWGLRIDPAVGTKMSKEVVDASGQTRQKTETSTNNEGVSLKHTSYALDGIESESYEQKLTAKNLAACHAGLVAHGYSNASTSTGTTNNSYKKLPAFTTNSTNSDMVTVKDNYQISVENAGIYQVSLRLQVSCASAFKRAYLAPFVGDSRVAAQTTNIYSPVANATYTTLETFVLELSASDVLNFRVAAQESVSVTATIADAQIFALDYANKYKS